MTNSEIHTYMKRQLLSREVMFVTSRFLQRCALLTVGPMECVWAELAAVRRAGPAQAVTSASATHSASNTEPARTESASVTRAGTESTAPSVSASVYLYVRVEVGV